MESFIARLLVSAILAGITVTISNGMYGQHWNYFLVALVWLVVIYGGILIVDSDDW